MQDAQGVQVAVMYMYTYMYVVYKHQLSAALTPDLCRGTAALRS